MAVAKIRVEVERGPVLRTALDVLEWASELEEIIPDWHEREREELLRRKEALVEICLGRLRGSVCKRAS